MNLITINSSEIVSNSNIKENIGIKMVFALPKTCQKIMNSPSNFMLVVRRTSDYLVFENCNVMGYLLKGVMFSSEKIHHVSEMEFRKIKIQNVLEE